MFVCKLICSVAMYSARLKSSSFSTDAVFFQKLMELSNSLSDKFVDKGVI